MKILITGSSQGIGRAIAEKFLAEGHEVLGMDLRPSDLSHPSYTHVISDVCKPKTYPKNFLPEILISNAAVQDSEDDIEVNLKGAMRVVEHFAFQAPARISKSSIDTSTTDSSGLETSTPADSSGLETSTPADSSGVETSTPADSSGVETSTPADSSGVETLTPADSSGVETSTPADSSGLISSASAESSGLATSASAESSGLATSASAESSLSRISHTPTDCIRSVVIIGSASGHTGSEFPAYAASKGGLLAYTKNVANRLAPQAICNSIDPGGVLTELNRCVMDDPVLWNQIMELTPLKRWATPEEIAEWVYFVGVVNRFMTGQNLLIDGGEAGNMHFVWPE